MMTYAEPKNFGSLFLFFSLLLSLGFLEREALMVGGDCRSPPRHLVKGGGGGGSKGKFGGGGNGVSKEGGDALGEKSAHALQFSVGSYGEKTKSATGKLLESTSEGKAPKISTVAEQGVSAQATRDATEIFLDKGYCKEYYLALHNSSKENTEGSILPKESQAQVGLTKTTANGQSDSFVFSATLRKAGEGCIAGTTMEDDKVSLNLHKECELMKASAHGFNQEKPKLSSETEAKDGLRIYVRSPIKNLTNPKWADLVDEEDRKTAADHEPKLFGNARMELDNTSMSFCPTPLGKTLESSAQMRGPNGHGNLANLYSSGCVNNMELNGIDMEEDLYCSKGACINVKAKSSATEVQFQRENFWDSRDRGVRSHDQVEQDNNSQHILGGGSRQIAHDSGKQRPNA